MKSSHLYEIRPRKDKRDFDLISDVLPFGGLWYCEPTDAIEYAKFYSRSHHAVIRVYNEAGHVIETHEHASDGKPDYLLYRASTRQTAIWYLNNNVYLSAAFGPTLSGPWSLVAP